jgi:hypothetical protein
MRHNSTPCVAAAALLFGGTLGLGSTAEAGLTVTSAYFNLNAGSAYATNTDASAVGSVLAAIGANSSLVFSGLSQYGFLVSAASDGEELWSAFGATIGFTADTALTVQLTGNVSSDSATVFLVDATTGSTVFLRPSGSGAWDSGLIQLAAGGNYLVGVNGPLTFANGSSETGTVLAFSYVPAPGAIALLGAAGLVTGRRRR